MALKANETTSKSLKESFRCFINEHLHSPTKLNFTEHCHSYLIFLSKNELIHMRLWNDYANYHVTEVKTVNKKALPEKLMEIVISYNSILENGLYQVCFLGLYRTEYIEQSLVENLRESVLCAIVDTLDEELYHFNALDLLMSTSFRICEIECDFDFIVKMNHVKKLLYANCEYEFFGVKFSFWKDIWKLDDIYVELEKYFCGMVNEFNLDLENKKINLAFRFTDFK